MMNTRQIRASLLAFRIEYHPLLTIAQSALAVRLNNYTNGTSARRQKLPPRNGIPVSFVRDPPMDFLERSDIHCSRATFHSVGLICFQFAPGSGSGSELIVVAISRLTNPCLSTNQRRISPTGPIVGRSPTRLCRVNQT